MIQYDSMTQLTLRDNQELPPGGVFALQSVRILEWEISKLKGSSPKESCEGTERVESQFSLEVER